MISINSLGKIKLIKILLKRGFFESLNMHPIFFFFKRHPKCNNKIILSTTTIKELFQKLNVNNNLSFEMKVRKKYL